MDSEPYDNHTSHTPCRKYAAKLRCAVIPCIYLVFVALTFWGLGNPALWDDEANTALFGQGVWETGDASALISDGRNLLAYRDALELDSRLRNRVVVPLQYFLVAPFVGLFPQSAFAARLPFAIIGCVAVGLMLLIAQRHYRKRIGLLFAIALIGNVSLILFIKQCRYYSLAILLTTIILLLYQNRSAHRWWSIKATVAAALLLLTNYLPYAALAGALSVDYAIWGRREKPLPLKQIAKIVSLQCVVVAIVTYIWWPLGKNISGYVPTSWLYDRLQVLWSCLRDLNTAEFAPSMLLILGACFPLFQKHMDPKLRRIPVGILVAITVTAVFSPQPGTAEVADVRYYSWLIPISLFGCSLVIDSLPLSTGPALALAFLAFHTTIFNVATANALTALPVPLRSTLLQYIRELRNPPVMAYTQVSEWMTERLEPASKIAVFDSYHTYPLMFAAPQHTYMWQIQSHPERFQGIKPYHVYGTIAPDYVVAFGPALLFVINEFKKLGLELKELARFPVYFATRSRPEIFWHHFAPVERFDSFEQVFIMRVHRRAARSD
jgi:hypothetical protein